MEIIIWAIITILLIFSGFFAGSETTLISCDRHLLENKAKKGNKKASKVLNLVLKPDKLLSTTLVGTNICVVSVSILFKHKLSIITGLTGITLSIVTTLIVAIFMLIFSEVTPKTIGLVNANKLTYLATKFLNFVYYLFFPVIVIVMFFSKLIEKIFKFKNKDKSNSIFSHKGELKSFFTSISLIENAETSYISNILNYNNTTAREIMTPLVDVISVEKDASIDNLIKIIKDKNYSKIPVYKERVDNLIGYIQCTDLIYNIEEEKIASFIKEAYYVPETKKINKILMDMQRKTIPIVFVIDEYGGASGVISDEDIAEEIVGDILFDTEERKISIINNDEIQVSSQVDVDDLNEKFNLDIEKDGFETVGGFVMYKLGRIPKSGEQFDYKGHNYLVKEADEKKIKKISIKKTK